MYYGNYENAACPCHLLRDMQQNIISTHLHGGLTECEVIRNFVH